MVYDPNNINVLQKGAPMMTEEQLIKGIQTPDPRIPNQRAPDFPVIHLFLAITYALLGREEEARASTAKTMELIPHMSVTVVSKTWRYKCEDNLQLVLDAMRKAGFPE